MKSISKALDTLSDFFAARKGLLPLIGIVLVFLNFVGGLFFQGWVTQTDLLLHLGIIIAIFGFLLARAL